MKTILCPLMVISGVATQTTAMSQETKKPNIVVFIADDLGWEEVGCYGNPVIKTPNIDWLAQNGMKFNNFYLTTSSSSPSRSSILSGLYPTSTSARNLMENMPGDVNLFTDRLHNDGYHTMLVGKSHGTNNKDVISRFDYVRYANGKKPWMMADIWIEALNKRPKDQPFFMFAASIDPHRPYKQGEYSEPYNPNDVIVPPYMQDSPEMREEIADYYNEIGRFDSHIGIVLEQLRAEGTLQNTIILVMTDNGRPFPQSKTRVNVQGVKSPFIVYFPTMIKEGVVTESLASSVDIAPTLLELAQIERAPGMQGLSIKPILADPTAEVRKYAFAEHNWHGTRAYERSVITKDYVFIKNWLPHLPIPVIGEAMQMPAYKKMLESYQNGELPKEQQDCFISPRPDAELFAIPSDIHCLNNIADKRKMKHVVVELRTAIEAWQNSIGDSFPGEDNLKADRIDRVTGERFDKKK